MTVAEWQIRPARKSDRKLLQSFACATSSVPWDLEVERFIQGALLDWRFAKTASAADPRVLLVIERSTGSLVGVAAHERTSLYGPAGENLRATKLEVVAVAREWQGKTFGSGERVSDVVMSAAMTDISRRVPRRDARVFAVVHEQNARSLALCRRHGLSFEMTRPHPAYRRLVTGHRK